MSRRPLILIAVLTLAACEASQSSGPCTRVPLEHLARPSNSAGLALICDPWRVNAAYREQYFPGYVWGDETWTVKQ